MQSNSSDDAVHILSLNSSASEPFNTRPPGQPGLGIAGAEPLPAERAAALLSLLEWLNTDPAPDDVLRTILVLAAAQLRVAHGEIASHTGDDAHVPYEWRDGAVHATNRRIPLAGTIGGWVIRGAQPYRCDDLTTVPSFILARRPAPGENAPATVLAVPLLAHDGRALAALSLNDRLDGAPFSDDDLQLAERLVRGAAQALERVETFARLHKRASWFRSLVDSNSEIISVLSADGAIRYESPSFERITGFRAEEVIGRPATEVVHPEEVDRMRRFFRRVLQEKRFVEPIEYRVQYRDGSWHYLEGIASNLLDDPVLRGVVVISRDITDRKRFEEQLVKHAFTDPLTGLPNRALYLDRLHHALAAAARRAGSVTIMLLEIDAFDGISASLGHGLGEALLRAAAERMQEYLRPSDTIAHLQGDQFALLFEDIPDTREAARIAGRLVDAFQQSFSLGGAEIRLSASLGVALSQPTGHGPAELWRDAETALVQAKAVGPAQYAVFNAATNATAVERSQLGEELREAIDRAELRLYYQPEVELASGRIAGVEALVRWQHPRQGLLLPGAFIPEAEETGLILPLGDWVLREACRQAQAWQQSLPRRTPLVVSVNVSAREFQQPGIVEKVSRTLRQTGVPPHTLKLEITESTMMPGAASTIRTLRALKDLGVRLAIDDFGTGYSSLSYLRQFPVDTIKIDQSFVAELDRKPETLAIVRAVTRLARALSMDVTAEGIERAAQHAHLQALHCRRGQGNYFWQPLPGDEMTALLQARAAS